MKPMSSQKGISSEPEVDASGDELRAILHGLDKALCPPLAALRVDLERVLDDPVGVASPERTEQVDAMMMICDGLVELTRSFRDYVDLLHGGVPLRCTARSLADLVAKLDREFGPEVRLRGLSWSCTLEGRDAIVTTDPNYCLEAVGHLVRNALAFTPMGGTVRITVRIDGSSWRVAVADSGPGIPAELLPRVFEPFVSTSASEQATQLGTGLGLAACRILIEQLGGRIDLEPGPQGGTTALIQFPVSTTRTGQAACPDARLQPSVSQ